MRQTLDVGGADALTSLVKELAQDIGPGILQLIPVVGAYASLLTKVGLFFNRRQSASRVDLFNQFSRSFRQLRSNRRCCCA